MVEEHSEIPRVYLVRLGIIFAAVEDFPYKGNEPMPFDRGFAATYLEQEG